MEGTTPQGPPSPVFPITEPLLVVARRAIEKGACDECFGRIFGRHGHGLSNPERARRIYEALGVSPTQTGVCPVCSGLFDRWGVWIRRVQETTQGIEWHRFQCGSRWDPEKLAAEEAWWLEVNTPWAESARIAFNRELAKHLMAATGKVGTTEDPEIVIVADLPAGLVELTLRSLYFQGRYRKLDRTLPQTRWPCRRCRGRGCDACQGTGKQYPLSVEELVAADGIAQAQATGSRFHGMGREDIDARMLGRGRPFVVELVRPRRRTLDVPAWRDAIQREASGRLEVVDLGPCPASEVVRVKEASPEKSYELRVLGAADLEKVNEALQMIEGRTIAQRTPTRVAHRRSDRVRTRRIIRARLVGADAEGFVLNIRTEAGTYVKEWVEGDGGRTEPSLSYLVGIPLRVESLDVTEVHDSEG